VRADGANDVGPIVAQVCLPADHGNFLHAELGHLTHEIERLGGGELVGARATGARATVPASEVALQRQLPHGVDRTPPAIDFTRFAREREPPLGRLGHRRDRQASRARHVEKGRTLFFRRRTCRHRAVSYHKMG
jgi:hypothetical protein